MSFRSSVLGGRYIYHSSPIIPLEEETTSVHSLENEFSSEICIPVNTVKPSRYTPVMLFDAQVPIFSEFLMPNEVQTINLVPHFVNMSQGLIVSVGTERSFFDLLISDETRCEGLVIRDIAPRVKAYTDFNILLLRISEDRREFIALASPPEDFHERLAFLREKIIRTRNIPEKMQLYYLHNLEAFANVFYSIPKDWTAREEGRFTNVQYYHDNELFNKLQRYAVAGKIIATIGDVKNLYFLHQHNIALIDTSNVRDYGNIELQFQGFNLSQSRVIVTTCLELNKTSYMSYLNKPGVNYFKLLTRGEDYCQIIS